ncbi:uncharacterized protein LOC112551020 [Alligator sinensis]|uniref:Uncharacterized protein LOC112551020 n=1 Tax=Alligator sinensis TaxID=38654 RepID=A0A3Q0H006_ALLSI|nr:uncharacterized protein LOC112551020 [Alligator sinensis]
MSPRGPHATPLVMFLMLTLMSSWMTVDDRESQYQAFQRQHIDEPSHPPFNDVYCSTRMKCQSMTTPTCKSFNTFIHADSSTQDFKVQITLTCDLPVQPSDLQIFPAGAGTLQNGWDLSPQILNPKTTPSLQGHLPPAGCHQRRLDLGRRASPGPVQRTMAMSSVVPLVAGGVRLHWRWWERGSRSLVADPETHPPCPLIDPLGHLEGDKRGSAAD